MPFSVGEGVRHSGMELQRAWDGDVGVWRVWHDKSLGKVIFRSQLDVDQFLSERQYRCGPEGDKGLHSSQPIDTRL